MIAALTCKAAWRGMAALLIAAALNAPQAIPRERETNLPAAAALPWQDLQDLANCQIAAVARSSQPVELMSFCGHAAMVAARLRISVWILSLDVMQMADWRPARLLLERALRDE
jgi:hypothetical protein